MYAHEAASNILTPPHIAVRTKTNKMVKSYTVACLSEHLNIVETVTESDAVVDGRAKRLGKPTHSNCLVHLTNMSDDGTQVRG
jgi:hypothetical protein